MPPPSPLLKVVARDQRARSLLGRTAPRRSPIPTGPHPARLRGLPRLHRRGSQPAEPDRAVTTSPHRRTTPPASTPDSTRCGWDTVRIDGVAYHYKLHDPGAAQRLQVLRGGHRVRPRQHRDRIAGERDRRRTRRWRSRDPAPGEKSADKVYRVSRIPTGSRRAWDRGQQVRDHYLWFTNLPPHCMLQHLHAVRAT